MPIIDYVVRLSAVRRFLNRVFLVNDEYVHTMEKEYTVEEWDEFGEAEHDHALDVLLDYEEIVTRAVLGELNAIVEYELKWAASGVGQEPRVVKRMRREEAVRIIESEYGISLEDLPGYPDVEQVRAVANAYKHDDGYSGEYDPFLLGYAERRFKLDSREAEQFIASVRAFLHALPGKRRNLGERRRPVW